MKLRILLLIAILLAGFLLYYRTHPLSSKVRIGSNVFVVDVAATEAKKQEGLSGRKSLAAHEGMLFPYDHKEQYNFWMRGMHFPLDFIWIDGPVIADITQNVPPPALGEPPAMVKPVVPVDTVLEVRAGTVSRLGIRVGDTVKFLDR